MHYLSRHTGESKEFVLHPAGMVSRHAVSYLIASVGQYKDLRQFALHRITHADVLEKPAKQHKRFNIDRYIQEELNTSSTKQSVKLVAHIAPNIAWLLNETPISNEQCITPLAEQTMAEQQGWSLLEAHVPDDTETLWWVFGLGEYIQVLEPSHWREQIKQRLQNMAKFY